MVIAPRTEDGFKSAVHKVAADKKSLDKSGELHDMGVVMVGHHANNIIAVIDIGTNSVLLTIAKIEDTGVKAIHEEADITRLGEGLNRCGNLGKEPIERTLAVIKAYISACRERGVRQIFAIGTAALREAGNGGEFLKMVKAAAGITIEILSGEREAWLSYVAASHDFGSDIVVVDIGGGSTEIITGLPHQSAQQIEYSDENVISIPIGSVVLTEQFIHTDPISEGEFRNIQKTAALSFKNLKLKTYSSKLIAAAGTATTLAAMNLRLKKYDHSKVHGSRLTINDIKKIISTLKSRTIEERKKLPGLHPKRADIILAGAVILKAVMERLGFKEAVISDRGIRWGVIYEKIRRGNPIRNALSTISHWS